MAILFGSSFPIRLSDQADVIRIFLELMREYHGTARATEAATNQTIAPRNAATHGWLPGELPDLD